MYDHQKIEAKWQAYWLKNNTFRSCIDTQKPKAYILDMFPYPSGAGLHVGHVTGYTATDIMARYKRARGFNVLHPMGWDSFGLPAEQYAVRTGTHPAETTRANIDTYRRQLRALGFSYDWDREIATSDPDYYKWTQWIFTKLYEKGLAYEADLLVNYCPALSTVLANEEVENGRSKEGGHPIERRPLRQWVLRITAYADRLLEDLEGLDWPEGLKRLQINWIGRSEGALISFKTTNEVFSVFTTRPDTLFGASYLVLAPEHPLVEKLTSPSQRAAVLEYQKKTATKSDLERTELSKEKTGCPIGAEAIHPVTGKPLPIWISDYVLLNYGTGAIMAVPAHDERDLEFANIFDLPILPVYESEIVINSASSEISLNGLSVEEAKAKIIEWLEATGHGKRSVHYKLRDWLFSRQRYWGEPFPVLHFEDGTKRALGLDELPLCPPQISDFKPTADGLSPLARVGEWIEIVDPKTKKKGRRESNTMPQWAGSCWYYLRFCDPHNEKAPWDREAEKYWMPVDLYIGGAEHAVLHLLYARFWHKVLYDCDLVSDKEPFQSLRNQGMVTARSYQTEHGVYVSPDEVVAKDGQYRTESHQVLHSQMEKMSKSKLNGVSPDEIIEEFGADALRLYEMFMGPLEKEKVWQTEAVSGVKRFLNRFYDIVFSDKVVEESSVEALKLGHRLLHGACRDIEALLFNTAIAKMMEFLNEFSKLDAYPREVLKMATQVLAPFAPHLAEEAWEHLGGKTSLAYEPLPEVQDKYLVQDSVTYIVQVNGKVRGKFELPKGQSKEAILELAKEHPIISKYLQKEVLKVVFVPDKLLNFVMGE